MMPETRRGLLVLELFFVTVTSLLVAIMVQRSQESPYGVLLVACLLFATSGVKRGQDVFVEEARRASDLAMLTGMSPGAAYLAATSQPLRRRARLLVAVCLMVGVAVQVGTGSRPLQGLIFFLPLAVIPSIALTLRELVAHGAVIGQNLRIPQYLYLAAGGALGLALHRMLTRAPQSPTSASVGPIAVQVVAQAIGLTLVTVIVWVGLDRLLQSTRRIPLMDVTQIALTSRRPVQIALPLAAYQWRARGRKRSSLVIGFTAIVTLLGLNLGTLVNSLPTFGTLYVKPELGVIVVYVCAYLLCVLFATPLDLRGASARAITLRLLTIPGYREISHSVVAILVPAAVGTIVATVAVHRLGGFPGVPIAGVGMLATLLLLAALNLVVLPQLGGENRAVTKAVEEFPMEETLKSSFVALLTALLAAGYLAAESGHMAVVALGSVAVGAFLVARLVLKIRQAI
jgi:hypothetical protein